MSGTPPAPKKEDASAGAASVREAPVDRVEHGDGALHGGEEHRRDVAGRPEERLSTARAASVASASMAAQGP
jgi:hypothetical protein